MDIEKIISKMTLEQKVGQLCVPILQKDNITDDLRYFIEERHIGFLRFCPNAEFDNASVIVGEPNKYFSAGEMAEFLNSVPHAPKVKLMDAIQRLSASKNLVQQSAERKSKNVDQGSIILIDANGNTID